MVATGRRRGPRCGRVPSLPRRTGLGWRTRPRRRRPVGCERQQPLLVSVAVQDHGPSRRRHQLQGPARQRSARVIPDVSGHQIDRRRLALAGGATQRRQHAPEWTVTPLKQHLHRVQDCPRRTWTPQFKPALGPVGQALVEMEGRRVHGALCVGCARVDFLDGQGKHSAMSIVNHS